MQPSDCRPSEGILTRGLLYLKHTSRQSCSVHGAFKNKVWRYVAERVTPLKELRWSRTMLTSPRTVREISRSSILAEQGRLLAFPNVPPERSVERLALRHSLRPWTRFRLGRVFSSLGVCLRRKSQIAARVALPVIILSGMADLASAQNDATWTGIASPDWNTAVNWNPAAPQPEQPRSVHRRGRRLRSPPPQLSKPCHSSLRLEAIP